MAEEATLRIPAIHCDGCVKAVTAAVEALRGAKVADASREGKTVRVRFDGSAVSLDRVREALDEVGFSPEEWNPE